MKKVGLLACAAALTIAPLAAQTVPEGMHSESNGPSSLCGISGSDALAIRAKLRSTSTIEEKPSGSLRFETYFSTTEAKQWTVTTEVDSAYPAVTCVHLFDSDGGTDMRRQMRCDSSRERCDALFSEFRTSDEQVRKNIRGR